MHMFTQHVPMIIPAFTDRPVSALSCRDHFCIALVAGDGVYGWGSADQGQLGDQRGAHMVSSQCCLKRMQVRDPGF